MEIFFLPLLQAVAALSALLCLAPLALFAVRFSKLPPLPGPDLKSYLPGGAINRILRDPRRFSTVLDQIGPRYGRAFALWIGLSPVIMTSVPADIVQMSSNPELFPRPSRIREVFNLVAPGCLFSMDNRLHHIVRRKLRDSFNHSMLRNFHGHMTVAIAELCDALGEVAQSGEVTDISKHIGATTFMVITNVAFGTNMHEKERHEFADAVNKVAEEMMIEWMHFPLRQAFECFGSRRRFYEYRKTIFSTSNRFIQKRIAETKEEAGERQPDMLDAILAVEDCPEDVLASLTAEFAMAGSHTTEQMTAWAIFEICCSPRIAESVEAELTRKLIDLPLHQPLSLEDVKSLTYVRNVWKETCRLHPVGSSVSRVATKDITLKGSGIRVPKGTEVHGWMRRSQRDPEIWDEPLTFKPERWGLREDNSDAPRLPAGAYMPFGIGQLNCAGRFLADYEGPLIIAELYRRFKFSLGCKKSEVKNCTYFIDTPKYVDKETGVEMGIPVFVHRRE